MAAPVSILGGQGEGVFKSDMQVKALLFDLGRVVIDLDFARVTSCWARAGGRDAAALAQDFDTKVRGTLSYVRHERGEICDETFFEDVRRALALDLEAAVLREGWNDIFIGEMPGIAAILRQSASRYGLYALSNTNPAHQSVFSVRFAEVLSHFRKLYLSHEMGLRKPEPAIYHAVAADLGLAPGEILFFDDLADNVAAARSGGMRAVLVRSVEDVAKALT